MSARGLVFSYDAAGDNPPCDICGMYPTEGAVRVHLERRPGVALFIACNACAVEISCTAIREFWPRAPPEPPPEPPASGGGSP